MTPPSRRGLTLVETIVVVAIVVVVAGIVYATTGPVREKARQAVCLSNLHRIGQAIWMYRQDYGGSDRPGTPWQMGFPPGLTELPVVTRRSGSGTYLPNDEPLHCPNFPPQERDRLTRSYRRWCGYGFLIMGAAELGVPPLDPTALALAEKVRRRGGELPIVGDRWHDFSRPDRPKQSSFVLFLRMNGSVSSRHVPIRTSTWQW